MIRCKSCKAHRLHLAVSVALLVFCVAITGCHKEKSSEVGTSPPAPSAAPPAAPSSAPSGVFVHRDMAPSPNGHEVEFCSILRFGKDGQVCNVNVSAELLNWMMRSCHDAASRAMRARRTVNTENTRL